MPENVIVTDNNLVALYRFKTWVEDEALVNISESPTYTGLNTMQVSGTSVRDGDVPANAPSGSGVKFDSSADSFHISMTSGNASGLEVASGMRFSFGFFGRPGQMHNGDRSWFTKHHSNTSGSFYRLQSASGGDNILNWELTLGRSNGGSNLLIASPFTINTGVYESVVAVVDTVADTAILYVSGVPAASSTSVQYSPGPSGWGQSPVRLGNHRSFSSQGNTNAVGFESGLMAEAFFMDRALTEDEVQGYHASGFRAGQGAFVPSDDSNTNDSQKDNIGTISTDAPTLRITAWNATDAANPSGMRHTESGSHPAFVKVIGTGSGITFNRAIFNGVSDPLALTVRNVTPSKVVSGIKVWLQNEAAFAGVDGYEVSARIKSEWDPNLEMGSGGGFLARNFAAASSVLRSDLGLTINGVVAQSNATSGEPDVSQYIYLALHTDGNFIPGTYGPSGFNIRITSDFVDA